MGDYLAVEAPWSLYSQQIERVVLCKGLTSIGDYAFSDCRSLVSVTIPGSVTSIGSGAFSRCASLASVTLPASLKWMGDDAFSSCYSLEKVVNYSDLEVGPGLYGLSDRVQVITYDGPYMKVIGRCGSGFTWEYSSKEHMLTVSGSGTMDDYGPGDAPWYPYSARIGKIVLSDGITHIGDHAFYGFAPLSSVEVPGSVTSIGRGAFCDCGALTSVTLPWSLKTIGRSVFDGCPVGTVHNYSLLVIEPWTGIPDCADIINYRCGVCLSWSYSDTSHTLTVSGSGQMFDYSPGDAPWSRYSGSMTDVVLPNGLSIIGEGAFSSCTALTSVVLPGSVKMVKDYAFADCASLASVTLSENLEMIGNYAFADCTSLTSVSLPGSLKVLGYDAFLDCSSLGKVVNGSDIKIYPGGYGLSADVAIEKT